MCCVLTEIHENTQPKTHSLTGQQKGKRARVQIDFDVYADSERNAIISIV